MPDTPASQAGAAHTTARALMVERPGVVAYGEALEVQAGLVARRRTGDFPDTLLLLQHPHVITLGTSAHREHILIDEGDGRLLGIDVFDTGRGGDVTYHGPGQLVGYPILDLKPDRCDLHRYVRDLEEVLIRALASFGIAAGRKEGLTGVWVGGGTVGSGEVRSETVGGQAGGGQAGGGQAGGGEKIAAIGVRVSSGWITSHGFALNVTTDLSYFDSIVPCGIREYGVTSVQRVLGREVAMAEVEAAVVQGFGEVFGHAVATGG
jgi:lipoyl(octanoyl) transferase